MAKRIDEIIDMGGEPEERRRPTGPGAGRMAWSPENPNNVSINRGSIQANTPMRQTGRFAFPAPQEKPQLNYMGQNDLDAILDQISAEEALPPHKKNAAKIGALKQQAQEIARRLESLWVQHHADLALPRLDEDQED